ncbi:hypothetical protein [Roseovarius sp.]|uniref:hypothetical protein n=1 Tax=Roseovarius sp. TaxID=1486281 RepID=UPI003BA9FD52
MPKFNVTIVETVKSTYRQEIEADTSDEAKLLFEDWIVNHPEDVEPVSEEQVSIARSAAKVTT